jgi:hypothetical protein
MKKQWAKSPFLCAMRKSSGTLTESTASSPLHTEKQVKYYRVMGTSKRSFSVVIAVLFIFLLYILNPTTEDFQAWKSAQAQGRTTGGDATGIIGVMKKGAGAVAGAFGGAIAGAYERRDYLVCSSYSLGGERYLGVAHVFIKLK